VPTPSPSDPFDRFWYFYCGLTRDASAQSAAGRHWRVRPEGFSWSKRIAAGTAKAAFLGVWPLFLAYSALAVGKEQ
jgi:hypothetical protein